MHRAARLRSRERGAAGLCRSKRRRRSRVSRIHEAERQVLRRPTDARRAADSPLVHLPSRGSIDCRVRDQPGWQAASNRPQYGVHLPRQWPLLLISPPIHHRPNGKPDCTATHLTLHIPLCRIDRLKARQAGEKSVDAARSRVREKTGKAANSAQEKRGPKGFGSENTEQAQTRACCRF